jgi:hypothetical protein
MSITIALNLDNSRFETDELKPSPAVIVYLDNTGDMAEQGQHQKAYAYIGLSLLKEIKN